MTVLFWQASVLAVFLPLVMAAAESGTLRIKGRPGDPVRSVDWNEAPELDALARRAQFVGNSIYPRVIELLGIPREEAPPSFHIVFRTSLPDRRAGQMRFKTVELNASYFVTNSAAGPGIFKDDLVAFDGTMVHELAHLAADYWHDWLLYWTPAPRHWVEGMADYVRFKLAYTNAWACAQCYERYPHYTSGYHCAGAFLLYVDQQYGRSAIAQLNTALRGYAYSDRVFEKVTGRPIDSLWRDFTNTPAFQPIAAKAHEYQQALGYRVGKPPPNVESRFRALVKSKPGGIMTLAALDYLDQLRIRGELPGIGPGEAIHIDRGERGMMPFARPKNENPSGFPATRWIFLYRVADRDSTYQYIVKKTSPEAPWHLTQAWRTDRNDVVAERFKVTDVSSR